jgi:predicted ATPase
MFRHPHRVRARAMLARALWLRGLLDQATDQARASLDEAQATAHKPSICWVLHNAVCPVTLATGDLSAVERAVAMLTDLAAIPNVMNWKVMARCQQARLLIKRGEFAAGLALLREALDTCAKTGWMMVTSEFQGALAEGLAGLGLGSEALLAIEQAITRADRSGEAWYLPELLRLRGELLLENNGQVSFSAAEGCFTGALERAEQQDALFWSLRAAVSIAHLKVKQGRADNARQILEPVYARFTGSFQTPDLRSARSMLETLWRA